MDPLRVGQLPLSSALQLGWIGGSALIFTYRHQVAQILPEGKMGKLLHALCSHHQPLVEESPNDIDCNQRSKSGGEC